MKKAAFLPLLFLFFTACNSPKSSEEEVNENKGAGKLEFEESSFDFGEIKEGESVNHTFKFKNIGTDPVEIHAVNVSCGCTVASKPMKPVGVGQSDEITINFNSQGKPGTNRKTVTVVSNAENDVVTLTFNAVVIPANTN
jgi:hypothetical protein